MKVSTKFKKYSTIVGSICFQLPTGLFYLQGNVVPYIVSCLHSVGKYEESDIGSEVWITSMYVVGFISTVVTSYLEKKIGMRLTLFVGAILISTGFLTTFFSVQHSMYLVAFTFGLIPGIGVAQSLNVAISNIVKWMPDRMGLGVGIVTAGGGFGVLVLNNVFKQFVNPDDVKTNKSFNSINVFTDEGIIERTPYLFILLGSISILIQIVSIFFIFPVPDIGEEEQLILEESGHKTGKKSDRNPMESYAASNLNLLEVLRQPSAYLLMVASSFPVGATIVLSATYKSFGEQFIKEDSILTNIGGVAGFMVPICRPLFGMLADKISHKLCILLTCVVLVILLETFYYTRYLGVVGYSLWLVVMNTIMGAMISLSRSTIPRCYGVENQASNQTIISVGYCIVSIGISLTMPLILSELGWHYLFPVIGILPLISILALIGFNVRLKDGSRV